MKRLTFLSLVAVFMSLVFYHSVYAAGGSSVYLPLVAVNSDLTQPLTQTLPGGTIPAANPVSSTPDYNLLSVDINPNVAKEVTAINFVNNAPNATTTITDVHEIAVEMGDLPGAAMFGKVYAYTHTLKTKTDYCAVFKVYRVNGDKYMTISLLACYDELNPVLNVNDQYNSAYQVLNQLMELYAKK